MSHFGLHETAVCDPFTACTRPRQGLHYVFFSLQNYQIISKPQNILSLLYDFNGLQMKKKVTYYTYVLTTAGKRYGRKTTLLRQTSTEVLLSGSDLVICTQNSLSATCRRWKLSRSP